LAVALTTEAFGIAEDYALAMLIKTSLSLEHARAFMQMFPRDDQKAEVMRLVNERKLISSLIKSSIYCAHQAKRCFSRAMTRVKAAERHSSTALSRSQIAFMNESSLSRVFSLTLREKPLAA
jgi:hypothetical protein